MSSPEGTAEITGVVLIPQVSFIVLNGVRTQQCDELLLERHDAVMYTLIPNVGGLTPVFRTTG
jgi:hypothetical protein